MYFTVTDDRGVYALLRFDAPEVFQYRVQHKRWDPAPWWLEPLLGFGDVSERRQLSEVSGSDIEKVIANPKTLAVYSDAEWSMLTGQKSV